jgi:hypothetical protein
MERKLGSVAVGGVALALSLSACIGQIADQDGAYYAWDDRRVHCAAEIDDEAHLDLANILHGFDHAKATGTVLELLLHRPGQSMSLTEFEQVLAGAQDRGLPFYTMHDLANHPGGPGVALMYDDWYTDLWVASEPLLEKYGVHVTIYLAHYAGLRDSQHQQIAQLASAGHDMEAHSVSHLRGPDYIEARGLDAYMTDEVIPSIQALRDDGYDVISYAYPFGMRTSEMDDAIIGTGMVSSVRALVQTNELRASYCPN